MTKLWAGDKKSMEAFALSLSADCDLDLRSNNMVFVPEKLSCHGDDLCQIIYKSHHALLSHGSGMNRFH